MGQAVVLAACSDAGLDGHEVECHLVEAQARGFDVLRGALEISGAPGAAGAAARLAVAEALAYIACRSLRASHGGQAVNVEVSRSLPRPDACRMSLRFTYAIRFADPMLVEAAQRTIERERQCGGQRCLLPRFESALRAHGQEPSDDSEYEDEWDQMSVTEWTMERTSVPGKGAAAASGFEPELAALARAFGGVAAAAHAAVNLLTSVPETCEGADNVLDDFESLLANSTCKSERPHRPVAPVHPPLAPDQLQTKDDMEAQQRRLPTLLGSRAPGVSAWSKRRPDEAFDTEPL